MEGAPSEPSVWLGTLGHAPWTLLSVLTLYSQLWKASPQSPGCSLCPCPQPASSGTSSASYPGLSRHFLSSCSLCSGSSSTFCGICALFMSRTPPRPPPLPAHRCQQNHRECPQPPRPTRPPARQARLPPNQAPGPRPQAPGGSSLPHPSLWRMGLAQLLQGGEVTSVWGSGKVSRRK